MKLFLIAFAVATMSASAVAADITVNIGQPGYYGRIDLGNGYPQPQVIYAEPRIITRGPQLMAPVYLRVPPGHRKNWKNDCRRYNACGERVFFVQDNWYQRDYAPRYQKQHSKNNDKHDGNKQKGGKDQGDKHGGGKGNDGGNGNR
jgi:hypothetical protein